MSKYSYLAFSIKGNKSSKPVPKVDDTPQQFNS